MLNRHLLILPLLCASVAAQQPPEQVPLAKQASAGADAPVGDAAPAEKSDAAAAEVKVMSPGDVPAELLRIETRKSKADIKCEVTITPAHGREVTVKGVVRNGKLIERFAGRVFVQDPNIDHPHCGVRLWWVDNTSGWIFLRYSQIRTVALTGVLTAEEREEIMRKLQAKEAQKDAERKVEEGVKLDEELLKMSPTELEGYLLREYPQDQGWSSDRLRDLKKKQLIDNQPLTRQESIFISNFPVLIRARLRELKREKDKFELEPGSADKPVDPAGTRPAGSAQPQGQEPGAAGVPPAEDEPLPEESEPEEE